jgi:hypothetical protein
MGLQDGIGQSFAVYGSGDAEVLQFIVEEHDGVVCLLLCKPAESIGERHIIIFMGYAFLSLCADSQQQGKKDECDMSIHGG